MISNHIEDVIVALTTMRNGMHKNKAISHLQDALAHARLMEQDEQAEQSTDVPIAPAPIVGLESSQCICPEGAMDARCPVHGRLT